MNYSRNARALVELREWGNAHLPTYGSLICYDLGLHVMASVGKETASLKQVYRALPYSEAHLRRHLRRFEKDAYLYDNLATVHSYVHRRDLFERFGLFDEAMGAADDWEMWLRMSREIDFVHVDRVTVEYSWRRDPSTENMTFRKQRAFAGAHQHVAQKHGAVYARWPTLLRGRYETAARFNALAEQLEANPSLAHALFVPPDPVP